MAKMWGVIPDDGMRKSIGSFIWERMTELGMMQKDLAQRLDISPAYMSDIITGKRDVRQTALIERIATALSITPDILYYYAGMLPPDINALAFPPETIVAAFMAMRRVLVDSIEGDRLPPPGPDRIIVKTGNGLP